MHAPVTAVNNTILNSSKSKCVEQLHLSQGIEAQLCMRISSLHSSDEFMQGRALSEVLVESLALLAQARLDLCGSQRLQYQSACEANHSLVSAHSVCGEKQQCTWSIGLLKKDQA